MAKIIPIDTIKGMSGKVCGHSDTYFNYNASSGTCHTGKVCNPYTGEPTAKQIAQQSAFTKKVKQINAWLLANRPSVTNGEKGTEAYQEALKLKTAFRLSNIRQVISRYIDDDGKVTLPSGAVSSAPSGGSGGDTGGGTPSGGGGF